MHSEKLRVFNLEMKQTTKNQLEEFRSGEMKYHPGHVLNTAGLIGNAPWGLIDLCGKHKSNLYIIDGYGTCDLRPSMSPRHNRLENYMGD